MLLATRCPHCKTTFKVANDQLKLQSGLVRCGICHQVFNGIEHLAPADPGTSSVKINPATVTEPAALPTPPAPTNPTPPPEEVPAAEPLHEEREFDLFDMPAVEAASRVETALNEDADQRIEPVLDLPAPQLADTFFPPLSDELSDEFSKAQSVSDFAQKVQALLDADLQSEAMSTPFKAPPDEVIEEIILTPPEEQTLSSFESSYESSPAPVPEWPPIANGLGSMLPDDDEDEEIDAPAAIEEEAGEDELGPYDPTQDEEIAHLLFIRQAQTRKRLKWIMTVGTVLLALLLIGQAAFQFRNVLAAAYPKSKDSLVLMCKLLQCQIRLPALQDAISYEADELHNLPHENTFEFSLLMRNHSALPQAWPNIELTLKDNKKQVVLRRVFSPASYLLNPADELNGFGPNQEQPVKLYFVVDKVTPTDYTVSIFYP